MCGWQIKIFDGDKSRGVANATWVGSFFSRENVRQFLLVEKHRIGGKSLFGGLVACTFLPQPSSRFGSFFFARTEQRCEHPTFRFSVAGSGP